MMKERPGQEAREATIRARALRTFAEAFSNFHDLQPSLRSPPFTAFATALIPVVSQPDTRACISCTYGWVPSSTCLGLVHLSLFDNTSSFHTMLLRRVHLLFPLVHLVFCDPSPSKQEATSQAKMKFQDAALAMLPLATSAITVVQSNDDGWAVSNIRQLYASLNGMCHSHLCLTTYANGKKTLDLMSSSQLQPRTSLDRRVWMQNHQTSTTDASSTRVLRAALPLAAMRPIQDST